VSLGLRLIEFLLRYIEDSAMRIWVDLANSPHVPFFRALTENFRSLGHQCDITARDFAETVSLASAAGLSPQVIGSHGGKGFSAKGTNLAVRAWALARWARRRGFDLAVSHNSYAQILAARTLSLRTVTLMDFEYQPANHLAFRLSSRVVVPQVFPESQLRHFGARAAKVRAYSGTKEDVYLADFQPAEHFNRNLCKLGIELDNVLVVMRPPAHEALYHRFENKLFDQALAKLQAHRHVQAIVLPRNAAQREFYAKYKSERVIVPPESLDGANLIAASDLVLSAGGTMNREAAALGVPAASIYAGTWSAVDEELMREGRLRRICSPADIENLPLRKKGRMNPRRAFTVRDEVARLILD
jgi:predicted glycosyltransferase